MEEISCDPSSSPFSFHFLYLPDGKQLTTITSPSVCIHTRTHISLALTLTKTQTLNLILIVDLSHKHHSSVVLIFNIDYLHRHQLHVALCVTSKGSQSLLLSSYIQLCFFIFLTPPPPKKKRSLFFPYLYKNAPSFYSRGDAPSKSDGCGCALWR